LIILWQLSFFYILYKLYASLAMLLSREVLPDFAVLSFSMCCMSLVERFFWYHLLCGISGGVTVHLPQNGSAQFSRPRRLQNRTAPDFCAGSRPPSPPLVTTSLSASPPPPSEPRLARCASPPRHVAEVSSLPPFSLSTTLLLAFFAVLAWRRSPWPELG
jgi:hypothetical protein